MADAPNDAPSTTLTGKFAPALSAVSDAPVVVEAKAAEPEAKQGEVKAEEAKVEAKTDATETKADGEGESDGKSKDETPPWMKREITKARNGTRAAEARADDLQKQLNTTLKALENVTGN